MQDRTIQYNTVQHNTIKHHTKYHTTLKTVLYRQNYKKKSRTQLYTIKIQKRLELKVDESLLKTTRCTKQSVNHTIQ